MKSCAFLFVCILLSFGAIPAVCQTRALLVACHTFLTQPSTGYGASGNVQSIAAAFTGAGLNGNLRIEDGTIGSAAALNAAVHTAFEPAVSSDLSILYLCTHGFLPETGEPYLLLSDGLTEENLARSALLKLLSEIPGEKLLILDACHSGAWADSGSCSSFFDSSLNILASSLETESAWYYEGKLISEGALSYFTTELCAGLGLYGRVEADADRDGNVTLQELHRYLLEHSPSSTAVLLSENPEKVILPSAPSVLLSRPLTYFTFSSFGQQNRELHFSCTAFRSVEIQYRIIEETPEGWNWENAAVFSDFAETSGRFSRTVTLDLTYEPSRILFQVFSVENGYAMLCAEHLFQPLFSR